MVHLGDITKINGAEIEPVDVIVGGSPCQDLSVAGKRAGLAGERSGLFMEQIRIVKEMRERYGADKPRFMVWENVPGAFSSADGEDFRIVLEETARVADSNAVIPRPPGGKWATAGTVMGDGWSIAWRVLDAQFWGVPQRRRRIALVADFGGQSAPEVLFERISVSGDSSESGAQGQGITGDVEDGVGKAICYGISSYESNAMKSANPHSGIYEAETARTLDLNGGNPACNQGGIAVVFDARGNGDGSIAPTTTGDYQNRVTDYTGIVTYAYQRTDELKESQVSSTQSARQYKSPTDLVAAVDCRNGTENPDINGTLQAKPNGGTSYNLQNTVRTHQSVRRLTPIECERLQGFPDNWTNIPPQTDVTEEDLIFWRPIWSEWQAMNGKKPKTDKQIVKWLRSEPADSARYKALGNSIALPPWRFVLSRICRVIGRKATLGSLFDGIGGFPLIWEEINGKGSARWASEIEPFPIAVTKYHCRED